MTLHTTDLLDAGKAFTIIPEDEIENLQVNGQRKDHDRNLQ